MAKDSAILPGYISIGIRGDHSDMAKFSQTNDPGFMAICREIRRWARDMGGPKRSEVPRLLPGSDANARNDSSPAMHGDGNIQYIASGGRQTIVGGNYFEAGATQNFGTVPGFQR